MRRIITTSIALILVANGWLNAQAQSNGFQLVRKTVIGGTGGWDYLVVDPDNRRLYVSHSTQVEVLNADTHEKVGVIPNTQGVHGIAVVPDAGRGITTNGRTNTATIFDLKTLKPIQDVPTGKNPDALLYDHFSDRVFIFDHTGGTCTVVDIRQAKVIGTINLGGEGVEAGVSDEHGTIFVNLEDASEIVSFDAKSLVLKSRWKITPGEEPTGLAMDRKNHRLFAACHNEKLMVIDSDNGKIVAEVPIGKRVDGAAFDPATSTVFTSNGEGSVTLVKVVSANEFKVIETAKTELGARTIALDTKTHHIFVSTAQYGETPAATTENPRPRPAIVPETFMILELGSK